MGEKITIDVQRRGRDFMNDFGLKPCPFCGQDANKAITRIEMISSGFTKLEINCCMRHVLETDTAMSFNGGVYPVRNLIEIWNHRDGED